MLEIQRDTLLATVDTREVEAVAVGERAHGPSLVTIRTFDLDDPSAQIGQGHRAKGPGEDPGEVQDERAVEKPTHDACVRAERTRSRSQLWNPIIRCAEYSANTANS